MTTLFTAAVVALVGAGLQEPPPRDNIRVQIKGTARISGIVVTGEASPRPVRRAIVTIKGSPLPVSRGTITDDGGRFEFSDLPAGRFTVTASRKAFITTAFGAKRPGGRGTPVSLADGAHARDVRITLARGAVLTGVITDPNGLPVPSLPVTVFHVSPTYSTAGQDVTDDRGVYRVYGLAPGDYVVAGVPRPTGVGEMAVMSEKQVDAVLGALARRGSSTSVATRPGAATPPAEGSPPGPPRVYSFAPFFYPGTAVASDAARITVAAGEERTGLDFTLGAATTASITGVVIGADGQPARDVQLTLLSTGPSLPVFVSTGSLNPVRTGTDGTFQLTGVTPGSYRITARRLPASPGAQPGRVASPSASTGRGPATEWAVSEVTVNGDDVAGLLLTLRPGLRVTGRLTFEGTATVPSNLSAMRVTIVPAPAPSRGTIAPVPVKPDSTFEITNLMPGTYMVGLTMPDDVADIWWPRTAVARDRDALDVPIDLTSGADFTDVVFTLSDRRPSLSGIVRGVDGQAASDAMVIVFSAERAHWHAQSRRIRAERPSTDGRYEIAALPPGDYFVAAVVDAEQDEWIERAFLERLVTSAARVTVGEGEQKTQDIRAGPRR